MCECILTNRMEPLDSRARREVIILQKMSGEKAMELVKDNLDCSRSMDP